MPNTLYYGDNLQVMRDHLEDASIDLVYLDPPFNSNRDYNVLFKEQSGIDSPAQIKAFGDTWKWANAALDWENFPDLCPNPRVQNLMQGFVDTLGQNDVTAYLVMMAPRLHQLHRVLKPTGSLYLHCDPTASHYLKLLLDAVFGPRCFRNEIIGKRKTGRGDTGGTSKRFGNATDILLFYGKSEMSTFHPLFRPNDPVYLEKFFNMVDENGRRYASDNLASPNPRPNLTYEYKGYAPPAYGWAISREKMEQWDADGKLIFPKSPSGRIRRKRYFDELQGEPVQNIWDDINALSALHSERLGYPTQKPLALLERIIAASSNPGDTVLDPFCGCGTAIVAAQALGRQWIGIDITPIATSLIIDRLADKFQLRDQQQVKAGDPDYARAFTVKGLPEDIDAARKLFRDNAKDFEMWAVGKIPMKPQDKKGADGGIDGLKDYSVGDKKPIRAVAQVKGGKVGVSQIRDLVGVMTREKATLGLFACLEPPTQKMLNEALRAGFYTLPLTGRKIQCVQIRTINDLLEGRDFDLPSIHAATQAVAEASSAIRQMPMDL